LEGEPHLIGGRAVTRHAIRRQLRRVQLGQVFHLSALEVDVLVETLSRGSSDVTT
jgi:ribonuclease P protein component